MIGTANSLTDLFLSSAGLIGLAIVHDVLQSGRPDDPLTRRFVFALRVAMMLFVGRALIALTGAAWFRSIVLLAAALIPLAAVIVAEGLLRRHAPVWAKWVIGTGTVGFSLTAFWFGTALDPARLISLLAFQVVGFAIAGWMITTRDRDSLNMAENESAGRLGWSLVVLVPLAASDFLLDFIRLPVQISAVGVLFMCWAVLGLARSTASHRAGLTPILIVAVVGALTGGLISTMAGAGREGIILGVAISTSVMLVFGLWSETRTSQASAQSAGLIAHLARAPLDSPLAFLRGLKAHPMVSGAVVIAPADLSGFDPATLTRIFTASPVLRKSGPPAMDPEEADHIAHLFARFGATHILDLGQSPRQLVALAMPALQSSPSTEVEVDAVQRLAALIAKGGLTGRDDDPRLH